MGIKFKSFVVLALVVGCLAALWPTYQAYKPGGDPSAIRNKVNLGLDLQGGMYLDLEVDVDAAVERLLDRLATELEDGLQDTLVDYEAVERIPGGVSVVLGTTEAVDWNRAPFDRMLTNFNLEQKGPQRFTILLSKQEEEFIRKNSVTQALEVIRNRIDALGVSEPTIQRKGETDLIVQLPGLKNREMAIATIGGQAVLEFFLVVENVSPQSVNPAEHRVLYEERREALTNRLLSRTPYVVEKRPALSGEAIRSARVEINNSNNQPVVSFAMDSQGAERFGAITTRNVNRRLAIVLDDKVQSAPVIREPITGGSGQISGQFTMDDANRLAIQLRSGSLPAPLNIREERSVGASLGEDSIRQGVTSLVIGVVLVMGFMMVYYLLAGLFASVALILNLLLILTILAAFQATLTLPGIAGLVLTMGMAVDANVLIFERIREELSIKGRSMRQAVSEGFGKAFWTIFDSNLTTLVAALALAFFGSGPIMGFAIILSIGILCSMFTAIFVTRLLFELVYFSRRGVTEISI
ncbi:MAG: protein translocase subunit SecD [Deltaproteobacteria bacterium]|nr:protein translocase subunit SecD [Deltaproteobacteria bacterium]